MIESLEDLTEALLKKKAKLFLFQGSPEKIAQECISLLNIDAVVVNKDYTPYSIQRDLKLESLCKKSEVSFLSFEDALLHPPEETVKSDGKPYTIFTPFYRNASKLDIAHPVSNRHDNYFVGSVPFAAKKSIYHEILPKRLLVPSGGRTQALTILKKIGRLSSYESLRDFPSENATSHLSAHLKFTTCSVREVFWAIFNALGSSSALIRSLYWRDFFTSIAFHFPHVFSGAFHKKFDRLSWENSPAAFKAWCSGKTGFPLVDAGMRELNETGFMHNRVRMLTASFLVKDLHIDWRWGEKYFAKKLVDYDPAVNNGNWQWAASTGCDAQPYFRVFNPWSQSSKFDPDCIYIKRWIPELTATSPNLIHKWYLAEKTSSYPLPIVDHAIQSKKAIAAYKKKSH